LKHADKQTWKKCTVGVKAAANRVCERVIGIYCLMRDWFGNEDCKIWKCFKTAFILNAFFETNAVLILLVYNWFHKLTTIYEKLMYIRL